MIDKIQEDGFWEIINLLDRLNVLEHIIIVGSWAEYIYYKANIFENYAPFIKTQDIDFLIINKAKPKEKIELVKEFEKIGYTWDSSINGLEVLRNDIFEIQFMLRELGRGSIEPVKYEPFNMKLEGMRDLNIVVAHSIKLSVNEKDVYVPKPAVYIIQKMDINEKRKEKQEKDKDSILNLYEHIVENKKHYDDFKFIFKSLTKKSKKRVIEFCKENDIDIPGGF